MSRQKADSLSPVKNYSGITTDRLDALRREKGVSLSEIGRAVGLTPTSVSRLFLGKQHLTGHSLKNIARYFNVSEKYLLGITNDPQRTPEENLEGGEGSREEKIGDRIHDLIASSNLDIRTISSETQIPRATLYYYMNSRKLPGDQNLNRIAYYFNVNPNWILGLVDERGTYSSRYADVNHKQIPLLKRFLENPMVRAEINCEAHLNPGPLDADYAFRMSDNRMSGMGIREGDLLYIKADVEPGKSAVLLYSYKNELFVRFVIPSEKDWKIFYVQKYNTPDEMPARILPADEISVLGEVIAVLHRLPSCDTDYVLQ